MNTTRTTRKAVLSLSKFGLSLMFLVSCGTILKRDDSSNSDRTAGSPTITELAEGSEQSAEVDQKLPVSPALRVTDAEGTPTPGVRVVFTVTKGAGRTLDAEQI